MKTLFVKFLIVFAVQIANSVTGSLLELLFSHQNSKDCSNATHFRCKNTQCIDLALLCDGEINCIDGSDEENCDIIKCLRPNYFKCDDSNCIPSKLWCDGHVDCSRGEDEKECVTKVLPSRGCVNSTFRCNNGECVPLTWTCDGKNDCGDNSDETRGCDTKVCANDEFKCKNGMCIPVILRCDNLNDCADYSDEDHCEHPILDMTNCTISQAKFACKDKLKCIDVYQACDRIKHCFDGSDEGGSCSKTTINACPNCTHECLSTPDGSYCLCNQGFYLDSHNYCKDINECETYGICDQKCTNTEGSYLCTCDPTYVLQPDMKTCKMPGDEAVVLYTTLSGINGIHVHSLRNFTVIENLQHTTAVSVAADNVYWSEIRDDFQAIMKASILDYKPQIIVNSGLGTPEDIDIDYITGNIYFTDSKFKHIGVCTNDGQVCTVLHNKNLDKPRSISLSPENGLLFWSDWGKKPFIAKSGMDGSDGSVFIKEKLYWPNAVTTDTPNGRLYWADAKHQMIESINFDGTGRKVVISEAVGHPFSISVFEDKLYWSNWEGNEISECDKFTGKNKRALVHDLHHKIFGVHVTHPFSQSEKLGNPCARNQCSDMCLLAPSKKSLSYTCACPDDKELSEDGKECRFKKYPQLLIAAYGNKVYIIEHKHLGHPNVKLVPLTSQSVTAMTYNSLNGDLIVVDSKSQMMRYNLQTGMETIIDHGAMSRIPSLQFDDFGNNLFWCNWDSLTIETMSMSTLSKSIIFTGGFTEIPIDLALVPEKGYMFVAIMMSNSVQIDRISMDGSLMSRTRFIENNFTRSAPKLYFDRENKRLFWVDTTSGFVESIQENGEGRMVHVKTTDLLALTFFDNIILWTKKNSVNIYWQDFSGELEHPKHLKLDVANKNDIDQLLIINPNNYGVQYSPCHTKNGGCSDICLASDETPNKTKCACPVGLSLAVDGLTCKPPRDCSSKEFRCFTGECIPMYKVCNKHRDCLHGDDEFVHNCGDFKCPAGQFMCNDKKKCIDMKLVCDGKSHCDDQSDEVCHVNCTKGQFRCDSGECIERQFRCDGKVDCRDGFDERNCQNATCSLGQFKCKSGQCIPAAWYCDGEHDCTDGSDENKNCSVVGCNSDEFHCTNNECVQVSVTCDGHDDCGDGSDEDKECVKNRKIYEQTSFYHIGHAGHIYKLCNSRTEFHCKTSSGHHCIPISLRCNGITDCLYGEDEKNCLSQCVHENEFPCKTSKTCIPPEWVCDHHNDCDDGSDEEKHLCLLKNITGKACDGFRCNDGQCISSASVCNDILDCADKSDEGGFCGKGCENYGCTHQCNEQPAGPKCSCMHGFILGSDNKTCIDVDECQMDICAQNCTNTPGSFVCSCFTSEYTLRSDHVSCKANGDAAHFVIASLSEINVISNNWMRTEHVASVRTGSMITAMDVDNRRGYVYTILDYSTLERNDVLKKETELQKISFGYGIAVDWITENIYYNEARTRIKIFSYNSKTSATVYDTEGKSNIISIAVDPVAGYIFWCETHIIDNVYFGQIKRAECSGEKVVNITVNIQYIADSMFVDSWEKYLYWFDKNSGTVFRMNYDGSAVKLILDFETNIAGFSFFENSIYWASSDSDVYPIRKCKIYGLPPKKCEVIKSKLKDVRYFAVLQESRQRNATNSCEADLCSDFCAVTPNGPVCLCVDKDTGKSYSCSSLRPIATGKNEKLMTAGFSTFFAYLVLLCLIIGVAVMVYYYYKPKTQFFNRFHFSNTPFDRPEQLLYNSQASGINELAVGKTDTPFLESVAEESAETEFISVSRQTSQEFLIKSTS